MDASSLSEWFEDLKRVLESAYLRASDPRGQSGFSGMGYAVEGCASGFEADGRESEGAKRPERLETPLTRVALLRRPPARPT